MGSRDAEVCYDSHFDWTNPSPKANPRLSNLPEISTITKPRTFFRVVGIQEFESLSLTLRCTVTIFDQKISNIIHKSKRLYSTALLSNICVLWPAEPFDIVFLPKQWLVGKNFTISPKFTEKFHSSFLHIFCTILLQLCCDFWSISLSSLKLVTLIKLYSDLFAFGLPALYSVLFYPVSWCFLIV